MKTRILLPALILVSFLAAACGGVLTSDQPAKQYYLLKPYTATSGPAGFETGPVLAISVSAVPGLDTDRILQLSDDARLIRYANARWPDHLPEVLTSVMKRSMISTGRFSAVEESGRTVDDGWLVRLEVQQFYGIRDGSGSTSSVLVELAGSLECNGDVKQLSFSHSSPVAEERLSAIVAAHQRGLDRVTGQLLNQINEACA